jgi:SulP family sulfate permease
MESYAVARRIASANNELHILNASQELFANGVACLLGSISSAYPVAGSFSRSALNQACGAKTPLSKVTTLCVILIALSFLTESFFYIPKAALAAIIMVAIGGLINITDFWEAWKHDKKDFLVMSITLVVTFVFESAYGLAAGIGISIVFYLADLAFSTKAAPSRCLHARDNKGIDGMIQ